MTYYLIRYWYRTRLMREAGLDFTLREQTMPARSPDEAVDRFIKRMKRKAGKDGGEFLRESIDPIS